MQLWGTIKKGANLLDQTFVKPVVHVGTAAVHEIKEVTHPLVYAVEQPIENVINETKEVVSGLHSVYKGTMHIVPYVVGGWLVWTAVDMYFPSEKRAVTSSLNRAAKRMRLL